MMHKRLQDLILGFILYPKMRSSIQHSNTEKMHETHLIRLLALSGRESLIFPIRQHKICLLMAGGGGENAIQVLNFSPHFVKPFY